MKYLFMQFKTLSLKYSSRTLIILTSSTLAIVDIMRATPDSELILEIKLHPSHALNIDSYSDSN